MRLLQKSLTGLLRYLLPIISLMAVASADVVEDIRLKITEASSKAIDELTTLQSNDNLNTDTALAVIQQYISPEFNYLVLTKRTLGKHWRNASDAQKENVSNQFQILLERTYSVALSKFSGQTLQVVDATQLNDGNISVKLEVVASSKKTLLEYQLAENDSVWEIIEVKIEGVSLLGNYRRQFNSIVRKGGIDKLIAALEKKNNS